MTQVPCRWDGESFVPERGHARRLDNVLVVGERYTLEVVEARSALSHRHYFAAVNEAWGNLPDPMAERFPTSEHLRKYALIKSGYADHRQLVAGSRAEALRLAAFVRPMDEYAVVGTEGAVVNVWTAQSQSMRAMGKARFQQSKDAVLDVLARFLGVERTDIEKRGEAA